MCSRGHARGAPQSACKTSPATEESSAYFGLCNKSHRRQNQGWKSKGAREASSTRTCRTSSQQALALSGVFLPTDEWMEETGAADEGHAPWPCHAMPQTNGPKAVSSRVGSSSRYGYAPSLWVRRTYIRVLSSEERVPAVVREAQHHGAMAICRRRRLLLGSKLQVDRAGGAPQELSSGLLSRYIDAAEVHAVGLSVQMLRDWDDRHAATTTTTTTIIIVAPRHASFDRYDTRKNAPLESLFASQ